MFKGTPAQTLPYMVAIACITLGTAIMPSIMANNGGIALGMLVFVCGLVILGRGVDQLPEVLDNLNLSNKTKDWHNLLLGAGLIAILFNVNDPPVAVQIIMLIAAFACSLVSAWGFITILLKHIAQATLPLQPEQLIAKMILLVATAIPLAYWLTKGVQSIAVFGLISLLCYAISLVYSHKIQAYVLFKCLAFASILGMVFHINIMIATGL